MAGLEIFAADGDFFRFCVFFERGNIDGEIWRAVGEGNAFADGGIGVQHGGRDGGIVRAHPFLEGFQIFVDGFGLQEYFGGAAPDHHQAVGLAFLFEVANVFAKLFGEFKFIFGFLDVGAGKILDVVLIEGGLHGLDGLQEFLDLVEVFGVQDTGLGGSFVGVVGENIPAAEDDVVEFGERNELVDFRRAAFGALAEADGAQLRERADGRGFAAAHQFNSRHKCGAHGSHSGREDAQSSFGRSNIYGPAHSISPSPCEFSRSVHSRVAKPSLFRNGCVIGAVNAENKTSYDAARLEFLQIESEGMESGR